MRNEKKKYMAFMTLTVLFLVLADQATKWLAVHYLRGKPDVSLINGIFHLHYLENRGSAFGMLQGQKIFFIVIAFVMIVLVPYLYYRIPIEPKYRFLRITAIFFLAGAIGNVIDRIINGYVVDFLYFILIDFPVFNVADIYVTMASVAFILLVLFYYKEDELSWIFPEKK